MFPVDEQPVEAGGRSHLRKLDGRYAVLEQAEGDTSVGEDLADSILAQHGVGSSSIAEHWGKYVAINGLQA